MSYDQYCNVLHNYVSWLYYSWYMKFADIYTKLNSFIHYSPA